MKAAQPLQARAAGEQPSRLLADAPPTSRQLCHGPWEGCERGTMKSESKCSSAYSAACKNSRSSSLAKSSHC
jgi:hypothetical protein